MSLRWGGFVIGLFFFFVAYNVFFAGSLCGGNGTGWGAYRRTAIRASPPGPFDNVTVEDLMYKYQSDKSRDDHGYTKLYDMIFSPIRGSVTNMTEVGIAAGQSLQAWYRYFPNAEIHAFDVHRAAPLVQENLDRMRPRLHPHIVNVLNDGNHPVLDLGFLPESMDVIIEDGPHGVQSQQQFLTRLFPLLKPGGYYVIEDLGSQQGGPKYFHEKPEILLNDEARKILESNDAVWVDTSLGHRAWGEWLKTVGRRWATDHLTHNSYLVVIRKRVMPLRDLQMNYGAGAMNAANVVKEDAGERAT